MTNRMTSSHGISVFTGTIDQLLANTMTIDVDELDANIEYDKLIKQIMDMFDVDTVEADKMVKEAMGQCNRKELNDLVDDGTVNIVGYNEEGEPLYGLNDKAKKLKKNKLHNFIMLQYWRGLLSLECINGLKCRFESYLERQFQLFLGGISVNEIYPSSNSL